MRLNEYGIDIVKYFEGFRAVAYFCPAHILTIGWGRVILHPKTKQAYSRKKGVRFGRKPTIYSLDSLDALPLEVLKTTKEKESIHIAHDLDNFSKLIKKWCLAKGVSLNENQFSALVSFCYNVGFWAFSNSTLARLIVGDKIEENSTKIQNNFLRWKYAQGRILKGLLLRRKIEASLFKRETADKSTFNIPKQLKHLTS